MTDRIYELILESLERELTKAEQSELNSFVESSGENREEYSDTINFVKLIREHKPGEIDDEILNYARRELMLKINELRPSDRHGFFEKIFGLFTIGHKPAFAGAFLLVLGFLVGYLVFRPSQSVISPEPRFVETDDFNSNNIKIENVKFLNRITKGDEIEVYFDAVRPVRYKGNLNDVYIQRILAAALINDNNPGSKLRTINKFAEQKFFRAGYVPDRSVKEALIYSMKNDENPGVRRQALNVLLSYPPDEQLRDAFLYVLANDDNSGLRVASVKALSNYVNLINNIDIITKQSLIDKIKKDNNDFIRLRVTSLLKGGN